MSESNANTTMTNSDNSPPNEGPAWRSKVVNKPDEEVAAFMDLFYVNQEVYVKGRRGFSGPYTIDRVLGDGQYRLRDGQAIMPDIYKQRNLYSYPPSI